MKRVVMFLLCLILLTGTGATASAAGMNTPLEVEIPVGGTGTFYLKNAGAEDSAAIASAVIRGSGSITVTVDQPRQYRYELFSLDAQNSLRYDVIVEVVRTESGAYGAYVVIKEKGQDEKRQVAYYPVTVVPSITKHLTGDTPTTEETFYFSFSAVSTTVPELQGKLPMPADAARQSKRLSIVGSGSAEVGEIVLPCAGQYVYAIKEETGRATGYTYDKSIILVEYNVTEGPTGLEVTTTYYKDNEQLTQAGPVFVNKYTSNPDVQNPKTGDSSNPSLWLGMAGLSLAAAGALTAVPVRRRRRDADHE